jgi:hypothetical protein
MQKINIGFCKKDNLKEVINFVKTLKTEDARKLIIDLTSLLPHQRTFIQAKESLVALVAGFGSGKTHVFIRKILVNAFTKFNSKRRTKGLIVYPNLGLATELFVAPMRELLDQLQLSYRYNASNMIFFIEGMAQIKIYTLERAESIVGAEYTYAGIDEFDTVKTAKAKMAYEKIIGRLRGSSDAQIVIVTTPEGYRFTYDLMVKQINEKPELAKSRKLIKAKSTDNPYLPKEYLQMLRDNYDEKMLDQYMNGEFVNLKGFAAYYGFNRELHLKTYKKKTLPKDIYIGIDFNVNPMIATVWDIDFAYTQDTKKIKTAHCIREIVLKNSNTRSMANYIQDEYPNNNIYFLPDSSGVARKTSANIGVTDISILNEYGTCLYNPSGVAEKDKLNTTNNAFSKGKISIDPSCTELILDYEQIVLDTAGKIDKSDAKRTHASDGVGYLIYTFDYSQTRRGWAS